MSDRTNELDGPFGAARIEAERMPDGRSIHYYSWPAEQDGDGGDHAKTVPEPAVEDRGGEAT